MFALERAVGKTLVPEERLRIAAEVGSDLPLFLIGGTVLGIGRGEQVFPLADLPEMHLVVVMPKVGVSTPQAFADWDAEFGGSTQKLTSEAASGTINRFSCAVFAWLAATGVPAACESGNRAETPLLDLVRAGIENDFERVVFPKYPELREVKRVLERHGARYASLSGSGSTVYGLFATSAKAEQAAERMNAEGTPAAATTTLMRSRYWQEMFD
jgi:4-diphosphocytidyl-2-C-methyl-D-erythritol kinase